MKIKYKILKIHQPKTYFEKEKIFFIIQKKGWFGWKTRIKKCDMIGYETWAYFYNDVIEFISREEAMLYLRTITGKIKIEICGEFKVSF